MTADRKIPSKKKRKPRTWDGRISIGHDGPSMFFPSPSFDKVELLGEIIRVRITEVPNG